MKLLQLIVLFLCYAFTSNAQIQQSNNKMIDQISFMGDTVVVSAVGNHQIGYAEFQINNSSKQTVEATILSAELRIEEEVVELTSLHLMLEESEESVPAERLDITQETLLKFTISFPSVAANAYFGKPVSVRLSIQMGTDTLVADSPIEVRRRIPRQ